MQYCTHWWTLSYVQSARDVCEATLAEWDEGGGDNRLKVELSTVRKEIHTQPYFNERSRPPDSSDQWTGEFSLLSTCVPAGIFGWSLPYSAHSVCVFTLGILEYVHWFIVDLTFMQIQFQKDRVFIYEKKTIKLNSKFFVIFNQITVRKEPVNLFTLYPTCSVLNQGFIRTEVTGATVRWHTLND